MASASRLDPASAAFVRSVVETVDAAAPVVEAYVIGSGAVGPFDPATSDIDLVVVVEEPLGGRRGPLLERLRRMEPPVRDLELVVYVRGAQPPDYELNVSGGLERTAEPAHWFVIDAALAQEHSVPVWGDHPWPELFEAVPDDRLRAAVEESLAWSQRRPAGDAFARVNAQRARHWLERGEWIAKAEVSS